MDLNLTLIGQMITFAIFVWFTMKFVFPPIMKAMQERQDKISAGLAAAEQGEQSLGKAQEKIAKELTLAKDEAAKIIAGANQRAIHIIEESKVQARQEGERVLQNAQSEVEREYQKAKQQLMEQVSNLVITGAERVLNREIDKASNNHLVDELVREV